MSTRRLSRLAAAGLALTGGLALAAPASAAVTYDPEAKTGLIGGGDVRQAFGWTDTVLATRASAVVFGHDFWTDDTYAVTCGGPAFPVVHHEQYGRYDLTAVVNRGAARGAPTGYHGGVTGFRLTGPRSGISGTTVPPAVGQPCPGKKGTTIDTIRQVSSASGWALTATYGASRRELLVRRTVAARG